MSDDLIEGLEKHFGPMMKKPDDMPIDEWCKNMRLLNQPPFTPENAYQFPYSNGTIWDRNYSRAILTWLGSKDGDSWVLLGSGRSSVGGGACVLNAYHWMDGRCIFTREELPDRLKEQGWKCLGFWDGIEYPEAIAYPADSK